MKLLRRIYLLVAVVVVMLVGPRMLQAAYNFQVTVEPWNMTSVPDSWRHYFGVHKLMSETDPWQGVRAPGSFGWKIKPESQRTGPWRTGPWSGETFRLGLEDMVNNSSMTMSTILPKLNDRDKLAVINMLDREDVPLDRNFTYWVYRLMYEQSPTYNKDNVFVQLGNEINGVGQWNPWPDVFTTSNDSNKIRPYVESFFVESVKGLYEASRDVYNDNKQAIKVVGPSIAGISSSSSRQWLSSLMNYQIQGSYTDPSTGQLINPPWSGMEGDRVYEHVDILSVHYPFDNLAQGQASLQDVYDDYMATGKVNGIWITEEHGDGDKGPADMTRMAVRYAEWLGNNNLTSEQSRMMWYSTGDTSDPGGPGMVAVRKMAEYMGTSSFYVDKDEQSSADFYLFTDATGNGEVRIMALFEPDGILYVGGIRFYLPSEWADLSWTVEAFKTSLTSAPETFVPELLVEGDEVRLGFNRWLGGPVLISLVAPVSNPEPTTIMLLGCGLPLVLARRRRRLSRQV